MNKVLRAGALCVALLVPVSATAAMWEFGGFIDADQAGVTPPAPYFGGGFVSAILDDVTGDFLWFVAFGGLTGGAVAAHIHEQFVSPPAAGPIEIFIADQNLSPGNAILGGMSTSGSIIGGTILDLDMIAAVTGIGGFAVGAVTPWYVNIHTVDFPSGEIRGQLIVTSSPIPIPAAVWMMLSALGTLFGARRFA